MQEKLGQIQNTLDTIEASLAGGFDEMLRQIGPVGRPRASITGR
jgi:hypothetical protein